MSETFAVGQCRTASVRRQLFRAGTLDGAVLISNGFLVQCPQNPASLSPAPCLTLQDQGPGRASFWRCHLISELEKGILLWGTEGSNPSLSSGESVQTWLLLRAAADEGWGLRPRQSASGLVMTKCHGMAR